MRYQLSELSLLVCRDSIVPTNAIACLGGESGAPVINGVLLDAVTAAVAVTATHRSFTPIERTAAIT